MAHIRWSKMSRGEDLVEDTVYMDNSVNPSDDKPFYKINQQKREWIMMLRTWRIRVILM